MGTFQAFASIGSPDSIATSGVLYYEVELLHLSGLPQFGFATTSFACTDENSGDGVGDDDGSWGLDGVRQLAWYDGSASWECKWSVGDVIGFAANVDLGKIAVSKNGDWAIEKCGVVFDNEKVKAGVYPCMT